jgi:N-acetyl-gamma-glutamyl-phosphate reductase common form
MTKSLGIVGARGHVGKELAALLERHGGLDVRLAVSQRDGKTAAEVAETALDAYVLALPNGAAAPYVDAIARVRPDAVIVDLSADHRFDDGWVYGQPERLRARIVGATRIANPGCYATAMQLALWPLLDVLDGPPHVFGVSGYSGAGTTPSPKNDPEVLRDNLLPYSLVEHVHEREVARQLGIVLHFAPHVASFFRGITVTVSFALKGDAHRGVDPASLAERYAKAYADEPLVHVSADAPLVRDVSGKHDVFIGGLTLSRDGRRGAVVATIDNLLGGAASQALRNLNLALGFPERQGLSPDASP